MFCPDCSKTNSSFKLISINGKYFCPNESCFFIESINRIDNRNDNSIDKSYFENTKKCNDDTFFCPDCLKLNLSSNLILINNIYFCENKTCYFLKVVDEFIKRNTNTDRNDRENIDSVDQTVLYCPNCLKLNQTFKLILRNDLYFCENKNCSFLKSIEQINNQTIDLCVESAIENVDNSQDKNNSPIDNNNLSILFEENRQIMSENIIDNLEIIDLNEELKNMNEFIGISDDLIDKINDKFDKSNKESRKTKTLDQSTIDYLSKRFLKHENRLFNWTRMPYLLKTHSKIVKILLIHLDVFQFKENSVFDELRREYGMIETIANQYRISRVKPICYRFLHGLYEAVEKIPNKNLIDKTIDYRMIDLLTLLFEKYDSSNSLKFDYSSSLICAICNDNRSIQSNDYWISIEKNKTRLEFSDNRLSYDVKCEKCGNKSRKSIEFIRVPGFVILHFPKGMKEEIDRYDNWITREGDGKEKLTVVAVVECGSSQNSVEYPERPMSEELYSIKSPISDSRYRPSYSVHFRNSNGWYSLNGYKAFLSSPTETNCVGSLSDVRFVVLGVVSDPRKYRTHFSLSEISDSHLNYSRENLRRFFDNSEQTCSRKKCSKAKVDKTKPKRKYSKKEPMKNSLKQRTSRNDSYLVDLDQSDGNDDYNYEESSRVNPVRNCRQKNETNQLDHSQSIHIDIEKINLNFNYTESKNHLIETPQFNHLNNYSQNTLTNNKTSSGVSSSSSLFGIENCPQIPMHHLYQSENIDCSTIPVSHQSLKRIFDIDDMINKQSKRLKLNQMK